MSKGNRVATYDVAAKHLQIVQACVDHLHDLGATHELKILTGRLQRLALWATPVEPEIVKREQEKAAPEGRGHRQMRQGADRVSAPTAGDSNRRPGLVTTHPPLPNAP